MKFTRNPSVDEGNPAWVPYISKTSDSIWLSEGKHYKISVARKHIGMYLKVSGSASIRYASAGLQCPELAGFVLSGILEALEPIKAETEYMEALAHGEVISAVCGYLLDLSGDSTLVDRYTITVNHVRDYMVKQRQEDGER